MNRFEVISSIGEGAYGIVLKCKEKKTKKIYAIKKFKDKDTENINIKKVLLRELKALRQLKHPNIIQFNGSFKQNERLYLLFEYINSSLLDLQEKEPEGLQLSVIKKISLGVLKGLAEMHSNGLIHRDIKPENILVDSKKEPKIIDFGFCRETGKRNEPLTNYVATRWYRSPELLLSPSYGTEVDMWALGCVIGEMIDGQPLFPGDDFLDQLYNIYEALGPFPVKHKDSISSNEELNGINLDMYFISYDEFDANFIRNRYFNKINDDNLIDLLMKLLDLDGNSRITALEALKHPFFTERSSTDKRKDKYINKNVKIIQDQVEVVDSSPKSSIVLKNVELNIEPLIDKTKYKNTKLRADKKDEQENRRIFLPAIKTLIPFKSSFKIGGINYLTNTNKKLYGNTLIHRFK